MKCKRCGAEMPDAKRTCSECGAFLEGYTLNNVTGEYGYRGADGGWYKSEEEYRAHCSGATHSDVIDTAKVAMRLAMAERVRTDVRNLAIAANIDVEKAWDKLELIMPDLHDYRPVTDEEKQKWYNK